MTSSSNDARSGTTDVDELLRERVRRGASLLDSERPGWRDQIAPGDLDLSRCALCVIGQVFGLQELEDLDAEAQFERITDDLGLQGPSCEAHGFSLWSNIFRPERPIDYKELTETWLGYIKEEWS